MFNILVSSPKGFCAGVTRAIGILDKAMEKFQGEEVFLTHDIIHNNHVKKKYENLGIKTKENLEKIPEDSVVVLSAHGTSKQTIDFLKSKNCKLIDTSCPLVQKVHMEAISYTKKGYKIIYIGQNNHPESNSFREDFPENLFFISKTEEIENLNFSENDKIIVLNQTTLSIYETKKFIDKILEKFPNCEKPKKEDICYATTNRQKAIEEIAEKVDLFYVIGSSYSSNSNRLNELAGKYTKSFLIEDESEIEINDLKNVKNIGVSAGASAPKEIIESVIKFLEKNGGEISDFENSIKENMDFGSDLKII